MRLQPLISIFIQISKLFAPVKVGGHFRCHDVAKMYWCLFQKAHLIWCHICLLTKFGVQIPAECLEIQFGRTDEIVVEISWNAND